MIKIRILVLLYATLPVCLRMNTISWGLSNHASIQEEEIIKSYQYKLLDSIVELPLIDVDVIILKYVHRNLKNWRPERSKIWIIDFVEAFKKLQEKSNEEKN